MAIRRAATIVAGTAAVLATVVATPEPAGGQEPVHYLPPVEAPVVDPFRAPDTPFGAGNRGLTYDLAPGTPVEASADGQVVYAGPVAGTLHVTVLHADGLRTSYSFLDDLAVHRGQQVRQGDVVGHAGAGFHLGVRSGDAYLDPAALFGGVEVRVRLIPHEEPLPPTDAGLLRERIALKDKVREQGILDRLKGAAVRGLEIAGAGYEVYQQLRPGNVAIEAGKRLGAGVMSRLDCTSGAPPEVDTGGRTAILVGGHNSTSASAAIDDLQLDELGYDDGSVLRYAYGGGRVPGDRPTSSAFAAVPVRDYDETATWTDLEVEGRHLADLIELAADARPGAPVDVYAHSQGGIVTQLALLELEDRGRTDVLGQVVTMGTPHGGTDLATGAQIIDDQERQSIEWLASTAGTTLETGARSVEQMAEGSWLVTRLAHEGIPEGVSFRTVAARGDMVVTAGKASVPGHPTAILDAAGPAAHGDIPGSPATTHEVLLALAGLPPSCRGFGDIVLDAVVPPGVSFVENALMAGFAV